MMKTRALLVLLLAGSAGTSGNQLPMSSAQEPAEPFRVSVNVDLVVLHATVRDRKDRLVSDLTESDFEVYEDGVRQAIRTFQHEDIPVTVGLVVDHSGSMAGKLPHVMSAGRSFVQSSNPSDEMFVVNFNENVTFGLPLRIRFTSRADELEEAIRNAPVTGMTALYDAVGEALRRLESASCEKKVLIVVSDGADNASVLGLKQLLESAEKSTALVYTIGIFDEDDPDRNPRVLRRLAAATGGEAFFPGRLDKIAAVCERIARDIRDQYTIGYLSTSSRASAAYRRIRVVVPPTAQHRKLSVRTRAGYIPATDQPGKAPGVK